MKYETSPQAPGRESPRSDLGKFLAAVRARGLAGATARARQVLAWRLHHWLDSGFDTRHNVDTTGQAFSWNLTMHSQGDDIGTEEPMYLPTSSPAFRSIMRMFREDLSEFTFVDYGSGKGRTLLLAAEYPFRKIVGIEFAEELHALTLANIANYTNPRQRCFDIESRMEDATIAPLPPGPCLIYLFNPFEEEALRKVVARIAESWHEDPRKMYLVYYKPKHPSVIEQNGCFERSALRPPLFSLPNPYRLAVYETRAS